MTPYQIGKLVWDSDRAKVRGFSLLPAGPRILHPDGKKRPDGSKFTVKVRDRERGLEDLAAKNATAIYTGTDVTAALKVVGKVRDTWAAGRSWIAHTQNHMPGALAGCVELCEGQEAWDRSSHRYALARFLDVNRLADDAPLNRVFTRAHFKVFRKSLKVEQRRTRPPGEGGRPRETWCACSPGVSNQRTSSVLFLWRKAREQEWGVFQAVPSWKPEKVPRQAQVQIPDMDTVNEVLFDVSELNAHRWPEVLRRVEARFGTDPFDSSEYREVLHRGTPWGKPQLERQMAWVHLQEAIKVGLARHATDPSIACPPGRATYARTAVPVPPTSSLLGQCQRAETLHRGCTALLALMNRVEMTFSLEWDPAHPTRSSFIDVESGRVWWGSAFGKTDANKHRWSPLPEWFVPVVRRWKATARSNFVCDADGRGRLSYGSLRKAMKGAWVASGASPLEYGTLLQAQPFHTFRKVARTEARKAARARGLDGHDTLVVLELFMGHALPAHLGGALVETYDDLLGLGAQEVVNGMPEPLSFRMRRAVVLPENVTRLGASA